MAPLILLAEDDQLVRTVIQGALRREGFRVLPASHGEEALEFLDQITGIDMLVTDVYMGNGMSGVELAERVLRMHPGTPVLVISAHFESAPMVFGRMLPHLAKPFTADALLRRVRDVFGHPGTAPVLTYADPIRTGEPGPGQPA